MKKNLCTFAVAAIMIVATLFVSCSPQNAVSDNETVSVFFGELQAKDTTGINSDVYDTSDTSSFGSGTVQGLAVDDLYWSYKAVKKDDNFKDGETKSGNGTADDAGYYFVNVTEDKGLGSAISGFAKGDWEFTLRAFTSADNRSSNTHVIYEGTATETLTAATNSVNIDTEWQYPEGTGTASFTITASITQTATDAIKAYEITKVTVQYDGQETAATLTNGDSVTTEGTKTTYTFTGDVSGIPNGIRTFTYNVYVADSETATVANETAKAIIMTDLTTAITGSANITLTQGTISVDFSGSTIPDTQPRILPLSLGDEITAVGDTIKIGKSGETDIVWQALSVDSEKNRALLISQDILERKAFDDSSNPYADSDIRTYLNGDFLTTYGLSTDYMKKVDVTSSIETTTINDEGKDYVFLLSKTEAENTKYFADVAARVAKFNETASSWWLRSPFVNGSGYLVYSDGEIDGSCGDVYGVRPAFWYTWE